MNEAKKYDDNKVRMDLVPMSVIENIAKILTYGAKKYSDNSWQDLSNFWNRYKGALLRHLTAIDKGELIDQESGLPHIDHVLCNASFLSWGYHNGKAITIEKKDVDVYSDDEDTNDNSLITFAQEKLGASTEKSEEKILKAYENELSTILHDTTNLVGVIVNVRKISKRDYSIEVVDSTGKLLYSFHAPDFHTIRDTLNGSMQSLIDNIKSTIEQEQ